MCMWLNLFMVCDNGGVLYDSLMSDDKDVHCRLLLYHHTFEESSLPAVK